MKQPDVHDVQRIEIRRATLPGGAAIVFFRRNDGPTRQDLMKQVRDIAADALRRKARGV